MKSLILAIVSVITGIVVIFAYFEYQDFLNIQSPIVKKIFPNNVAHYNSDFSLENSPSESLKGLVTVTKDGVYWQDRVATNEAKLTFPQSIQQGETIETDETGVASLIFKDFLDISISAKTTVNVIQTLPANLVFYQTVGTASYNKLGSYPVSIRVGHLVIQDNGKVDITLSENKPISVSSKKGVAQVAYNNLYLVTQVINLKEGQTLTFNDSTRRAVVR